MSQRAQYPHRRGLLPGGRGAETGRLFADEALAHTHVRRVYLGKGIAQQRGSAG
ncbi:hypothetical protein GCM10009764_41070 [Nocardia ninae]|uniref:Uncharacterized protein n=1 Tax=Nocardia ninae NBRC 108245 TaxID=1210091 RepID=A0A511MAV7_9NOCA|nr:hypothetical protein NN4_21400 [Nocardia ninae NBRC 108245]